MKETIILISIVAYIVSGCTIVDNNRVAKHPAGIEKINLSKDHAQRYKSAQEPVVAWWHEFDDPQLGALVEQSLQTNLEVEIAYANLLEARAIAKESKFDRFPTITMGSSYSRTINARETANGNGLDRVQNSYSAGFDALWELDLFGRVSERIATQEALQEAALADLQNIYVSVTAEVARTYMELRGAQYRLDIGQRNAHNQLETYELTQKLSSGGRATALDVLRAKTQLDLARSTIPPLKNEVYSAMNRLSVLTGQIPDALHKALGGKQSLPSLPVSVAVGNVEELLKRRPDIRAAERVLAASIAQYNVAIADMFPSVNILGSIGFIATNLSSFGMSALAGVISPSLNWRAFDLGRVYAQINQADARSRAALASYEKTVLEALAETQTALNSFAHEEERRVTLQQAAASARQSAQLARQRFDQGVGGFLDVLDAERTLLEAEDRLAQSEIATAVDLIAIYKALGGGWKASAVGSEETDM